MRPRDTQGSEADWATVLGSTSLGLAFFLPSNSPFFFSLPDCYNPVMKLKQQPDDFRVEEITTIAPGADGTFAFYRMEKRGWSTPDALAAVRRRWQVEPSRLSYGGLKDRHAWTTQYLTISHGPHRG